MTMIAFAVRPDRVEVMTDSLGYTRMASQLSRTGKTVTIPHLDTIVATQGDKLYGNQAKSVALMVSADATTFDELADNMREPLRELWRARVAEYPDASLGWVLAAGYSPRAGRFVGYWWAADNDFAPHRFDGLFVTPSPWTMLPSTVELARCEATLGKYQPDDVDVVIPAWRSREPGTVPETPEQWIDLAETVRQQRAVRDTGCLTTLVGGDVFHTTVKRGRVLSKRIHAFNDSGKEFRQMIAHTWHPQGQLAACWCGSGEQWMRCHGADALDQLCDCDSGQKFRDCCVSPAVLRDAEHVR